MANPLLAAVAANRAGAAPKSTPKASPAQAVETPQQPAATAATGRSLADMRARLAGKNGGVNPPEARIADDALNPKTRETADGGAEEIPTAGAAPATPGSPAATAGDAPATEPAKRKRRTKAEMEAARAAEQRPATSSVVEPVGESAKPTATSSSPSAAVDTRIGDSLFRIAAALELISEDIHAIRVRADQVPV